jgi:hypothetical protein
MLFPLKGTLNFIYPGWMYAIVNRLYKVKMKESLTAWYNRPEVAAVQGT